MWNYRRLLDYRKPFRVPLTKNLQQEQHVFTDNKLWPSRVINFYIGHAGCLTVSNLESFRRVLIRQFERRVKYHFCTFLSIAVTAKPKEVRMGGVKGSFAFWTAPVGGGRLLFRFYLPGRCGAQKSLGLFLRSRKKLPSFWFVKDQFLGL